MNNKNFQLITLILLIVAIPLTVLAVQLAFDLLASADPGSTPSEIIVSNTTESSATVCWYTSEARTGIINYGTTATDLSGVARDDRDSTSAAGNYNNHCVRIRNLQADTQYFYKITSGAEEFTTDGTDPLTLKTLKASEDLATPDSLIGTISPVVNEGVVYAHASNGSKISTPISVLVTSSNYAISKSNFRDPVTGDVFDLTGSDILISFTDAQARRGNKQVSGSASQAETITISAGGTEYNPELVFAVNSATPTATPVVTSTPAPTQSVSLGSPNTTNLVTSTVSYGAETTNTLIPYNIFISNISPTTFCVNWLTKEPTIGRVLYKRDGDIDRIAIDPRDNASTQTKRYTHIVCFSEPDFEVGEKVGFFLLSNNNKYGVSLGAAESSRFVFAMPAIPSAPPSPGSVQGTLAKAFDQISLDRRDSLVYARYDGSTDSAWVSAVPSSTGTNWSLEYDSIMTQQMDDYYSEDGAKYHIEVRGEFNSKASKDITSSDDIVAIDLKSGLAVTNLGQDGNVSSTDTINGTGTPNSTVTVTIGGKQFTTTTNSAGQWFINVTALSTGTQTFTTVDSQGQTITMEVNVIGGTPLPSTAIEDFKPIVIGIVLIVIGYLLKKTIDSKSREYQL